MRFMLIILLMLSSQMAQAAEPAWVAFGHPAALPAQVPARQQLQGDRLAWHMREGPHDVVQEDWVLYLDFLTRHGFIAPPG